MGEQKDATNNTTNNNNNNNTLFVRLPSQETVSVRQLSPGFPVRTLTARVELLAALPAWAFKLYYGERELLQGDSLMFDAAGSIRNGALIKVVLDDEFAGLYECLPGDDEVQAFLDGASEVDEHQSHEEAVEEDGPSVRVWLVLCACCKTGDVNLMRKVILQCKGEWS